MENKDLFNMKTGEAKVDTGKYAGKNTDDILFKFGKKHRESRMADVPADYLRWVMNNVNDKPAIVQLATRQLEQRGSLDIPLVDLSPHSVDRASQRMLDTWNDDTDGTGEPGLYRWLAAKAADAIANGEVDPDDSSLYTHDGFLYIFALGNKYPTLKSVRKAGDKAKKPYVKPQVRDFDPDDDLPF